LNKWNKWNSTELNGVKVTLATNNRRRTSYKLKQQILSFKI